MNCTSFEEWLEQSAADRTRVLPADAAAHFIECSACRTRWVAERYLDAAIAEWSHAPLPVISAEPVLARLVEPRPVHRPTRFLPKNIAWVTTITALAALIVVGLTLRQNSQSSHEIRIVQRETPMVDESISVSDSVAAIWSEVRSSSADAVHETIESLDHLPQLPSATLPLAPVEKSAVSSPAWLPWSESIGENVHSAFGFLGDVVPMPAAG